MEEGMRRDVLEYNADKEEEESSDENESGSEVESDSEDE
jgi:hypothetical protein